MPSSSQADWLAGLEPSSAEAALLWPRTPIGDEIQDRIRERVGVADTDATDPRSRPARIVAMLRRLRALGPSFSALDIACGDALVLRAIKDAFPASDVHGIDINVDAFPAHAAARSAGVGLHRVSIQALFASAPPQPFDAVLMLNTYRGWESADLPDSEQELPDLADTWLRSHGRFIFLTAKPEQLDEWRAAGWNIADLGRGEEASRLACLSRERLPRALALRLRARLRL